MTTTELPPPQQSRANRQRRTPPELLAAIAAASAVGGALSDASPTGNVFGDVFWTALGAGLLAFATAHARRWAWFPLAGAAATVAQGWLALGFGIAALAGAFGVGFFTDRRRWMGAIVGGLAAQALLRGHSYGFVGLPTLIALAACVPVAVSGYRLMTRRTRKIANIAAIAGAVVIIPLGAYTAVIALRAEDRLLERDRSHRRGRRRASATAIRAGPQSLLDTSARELDSVATQFNRPWVVPARFVPVLGQHATAVHSLASAGADATTSAGRRTRQARRRRAAARARPGRSRQASRNSSTRSTACSPPSVAPRPRWPASIAPG